MKYLLKFFDCYYDQIIQLIAKHKEHSLPHLVFIWTFPLLET